MDKRFWAIVTVIVLVFVGILMFNGKDDSGKTTSQATNHTMGTNKNNVTLLEYGDYQCPACGKYYPTVKEVAEKYKDQITFQFRNLPLTQIHQNAYASSRAAEAAAKQNKFWEMHDLLYESQSAWSSSGNPKEMFANFAKQLGMNVDQFNKDFNSRDVSGAINADLAAFKKTGANMQTPSFFLNDKEISPDASVESFSKLIDEALKK